jgi:hypothetical protein
MSSDNRFSDDDGSLSDDGKLPAYDDTYVEVPSDKDSDDEIEQYNRLCKCEQAFMESNKSKQCLFAMAIGAIDLVHGLPLFNFDEEPYKSHTPKKDFKPEKKHLIAEVTRRFKMINPDKVKKCSSWPLEKFQRTLELYPITDVFDISYLIEKIQIARRRLTAQGIADAQAKSTTWNKEIHFVRLYHCLTDDDIKPAYFIRDAAKDRTWIDNRHSEEREQSFYELLTDKYNDNTFNPRSYNITNEHSSFTEKDLLCSLCPVPTDADKIKTKLMDCRVKLMAVRITSEFNIYTYL